MKFELCGELLQIRGLPYGGPAVFDLLNVHTEYGSDMYFTGMLLNDGRYEPMGITIADDHNFIIDLRQMCIIAQRDELSHGL